LVGFPRVREHRRRLPGTLSHVVVRTFPALVTLSGTFQGDDHVYKNPRTSAGPWPTSARARCYLAGRDHHASVSNDQSKTLLLGAGTSTQPQFSLEYLLYYGWPCRAGANR